MISLQKALATNFLTQQSTPQGHKISNQRPATAKKNLRINIIQPGVFMGILSTLYLMLTEIQATAYWQTDCLLALLISKH